MDNTLMMNVCGAWVRKPEVSSADRMNAWADEKELQFVAKYLGGLTDSLEADATTDQDIETSDLSLW